MKPESWILVSTLSQDSTANKHSHIDYVTNYYVSHLPDEQFGKIKYV